VSKRVVFTFADGAQRPTVEWYERRGLDELRSLLPPAYAELSDRELVRSWREYSVRFWDDLDFTTVSSSKVREFVGFTAIVEES